MKLLCVIHVFYPEMWPELAACVRTVGSCDLIVTYVDEDAVAAARRDFPAARFLKCDNRGYDVWPFLQALRTVDLSDYDVVVKLHTKRDIKKPYRFAMGRTLLNGSAWRELLLGFAKTPDAWRRTLKLFDDPKVGMAADRRLVFGRRETDKDAFDAAVRELRDNWSVPARRSGLFVAGTMFAVRAALLKPFAAHAIDLSRFGDSAAREPITYAHLLERMFGLAVCAQGLRIAGFNGSVVVRRLATAVLKFLFDSRRSERRRTIRVCGITVYRKKFDSSKTQEAEQPAK